jgi:hypothetical protein
MQMGLRRISVLTEFDSKQRAAPILSCRQALLPIRANRAIGLPAVAFATRQRPSLLLHPRLNVYSALQYGHLAQPVFSIGKNTRGCEFHRCMPGIGQDNGRSAVVTVY